MADCWSSMF